MTVCFHRRSVLPAGYPWHSDLGYAGTRRSLDSWTAADSGLQSGAHHYRSWGACARPLQDQNNQVFSPDGALLALKFYDGIKLYCTASSRLKDIITGDDVCNSGTINAVIWGQKGSEGALFCQKDQGGTCIARGDLLLYSQGKTGLLKTVLPAAGSEESQDICMSPDLSKALVLRHAAQEGLDITACAVLDLAAGIWLWQGNVWHPVMYTAWHPGGESFAITSAGSAPEPDSAVDSYKTMLVTIGSPDVSLCPFTYEQDSTTEANAWCMQDCLLQFDPLGRYLALTCMNEWQNSWVELVDLDGLELLPAPAQSRMGLLHWSSCGSKYACVCREPALAVRIFRVDSDTSAGMVELEHMLEDEEEGVADKISLAFSPGAAFLAVALMGDVLIFKQEFHARNPLLQYVCSYTPPDTAYMADTDARFSLTQMAWSPTFDSLALVLDDKAIEFLQIVDGKPRVMHRPRLRLVLVSFVLLPNQEIGSVSVIVGDDQNM